MLRVFDPGFSVAVVSKVSSLSTWTITRHGPDTRPVREYEPSAAVVADLP
jgi:hypothetical protein